MPSSTLTWDSGGPATTSYTVEYKKSVDSVWITAPGSPTTSTSLAISGLDYNTSYDFRVTAQCAAGPASPVITTGVTPGDLIWIGGDYICNQDSVFTLVSQVTGLSSPKTAFFYAPQNRMYVVDNDDSNGVFWWFDPDNFTTASQRNYIVGSNTLTSAYITAIDRDYNRLYATGLFSGVAGGLLVYDIAADTVSTIPFGSNTSFSRVGVLVGATTIYCNDSSTATITLINRNTLTVTNTINLSSIPAGPMGRRITGSSILSSVNGEIWVVEDGAVSSPNNYILRYSADLTTLIGYIDISAYRSIWKLSSFWGKSFYDQSKNKFYVTDIGASSVVVIDTTTNSIISGFYITNRQNFQGINLGFITDPITQDLYISGPTINTNDTIGTYRTYRLNRDTLYIEQLYPNLSFKQLERYGLTHILFGVEPGQTRWQGGSWSTDGIVTKFTR